MAEGYEEAGYHVPQQSRRDKLRVHHHHQQHHHHHVAQNNHQHQNNNSNLILHPHLYDPPSSDFLSIPKYHSSSNFMGFINNNNNSNSNSNSNSPPNLPLNPNHHHHQDPFINFNPSLFKPEPLSLSLSSSSHHDHHPTLNFHSYILPTAGVTIAGTASDVVSRCSDVLPFAPFTGYASILKGSRFLNPAQLLLEEFCDVVGAGMMILPAGVDRMAPDPALLDPPPLDCLLVDDDDDDDHDHPLSAGGAPDFGAESRRKKSRLISMLDEVYKRYKQYYQQMEAVVTSFECVAGLGNAAPYANLALKAMSKHFRSLKNAIADQLTRASSSGKNDDHHALTTTKLGNNSSSSSSTYAALRHNNGQGSGGGGGGGGGLIDHHQPVWRPQRGLPERAVTVLRAWLFEHFLHPYPTDTDKLMLAKQTGLSRSQVSNWFINARVRLWKPMVEEIHTLETRQAQKAAHKEDRSKSTTNADQQHQRPNSDAAGGGGGGSNPSTSSQPPAFDVPVPKRTRNNQLPPPPPHHNNITSSINDHHQHQHMYHHHNNNNNNNNNMESYGGGFSGTGQHHQTHLGSGGVSLTLGLHQHQGIGFLEPPPPSFAISSVAAQRFGLDGGGGHDGYSVMGGGGYDSSQNRHFGRDVIGGQLLHDFVG